MKVAKSFRYISSGFLRPLMLFGLSSIVAACSSSADADDGMSEADYVNATNESDAVTIPAKYALRTKLGTGINTVFVRAVDTPCVEYVRNADAPRGPALGTTKFEANVVTFNSSRELAESLGIQAGMSANFNGLVVSGSLDVDFGLSNQSTTSSESVYVLVRAWGENGRSQPRRTRRRGFTPEAFNAWGARSLRLPRRGGGNNFVKRPPLGPGRFTNLFLPGETRA